MKVRLIAILLVLLMLAGCATSPSDAPTPEVSASEAASTSSEKADKTIVTVYTMRDDEFSLGTLKLAKRVFEREYKNAGVEIVVLSEEERGTALQTRLMAGGDIDVLLFENEFPDLNKTIEAGVFTDLEPHFAADEDFDRSLYHPFMWDAGVVGERRWFVPLNYYTHYLLGCEEWMREYGVDIDADSTFDEVTGKMYACLQEHPNENVLFQRFNVRESSFWDASGLRLVDYEAKKVELDTPGLRNFTDFWGLMRPFDFDPSQYSYVDQNAFANEMQAGKYVFYYELTAALSLWQQYLIDDMPTTLLPFPSADGGTPRLGCGLKVAIPAASANKELGYAYIRALLSDVVQADFGYIPILNNAFSNLLSDERIQQNGEQVYEQVLEMRPAPLTSVNVLELYTRAMEPYWAGEASYDDCIVKLNNTLELYLYE